MEQVTSKVLIQCHPFLIKPNLYEMQLIMDDTSITADNITNAMAKARSLGIQNILVSLGAKGAVLSTKGKTLYLHQPNIPLVNKVGAGDAMLAAFIGKLSEGSTPEEALRYGGAAGNASASKLEDNTLEDIQAYLPLMEIVEEANITVE